VLVKHGGRSSKKSAVNEDVVQDFKCELEDDCFTFSELLTIGFTSLFQIAWVGVVVAVAWSVIKGRG
jgi:hypothetical protein